MEVNRRSFFKLLAGGAVVAAMPSLALNHANVPIIWGDGKHDDAAGLQSLIDGKEVEFKNPELARGMGWRGDVLFMGTGTFAVKSVLQIDERFSGKTLKGGTYLCDQNDFIHMRPSHKSKSVEYVTLNGMVIKNAGVGIRA